MVRTRDNFEKIQRFVLNKGDTIGEVKALATRYLGVEPDECSVWFLGVGGQQKCEDQWTLWECGVEEDNRLRIAIRGVSREVEKMEDEQEDTEDEEEKDEEKDDERDKKNEYDEDDEVNKKQD